MALMAAQDAPFCYDEFEIRRNRGADFQIHKPARAYRYKHRFVKNEEFFFGLKNLILNCAMTNPTQWIFINFLAEWF